MGNNYAKRVVRPQKEIGSKEFSQLWSQYAEPGGKRISSKNANKFLKDFVVAVKIKYDPFLAKELLRQGDPTMTGFLDEDQFSNLFFATTQFAAKQEFNLSASLAAKQRKLNKETDRDAGSGSTPSSPGGKKSPNRVHPTEPLVKSKKKAKQIEILEFDARSDLSSHLASEFEDSITSNAKSDLTGSHSLPIFSDRIEKSRVDIVIHT